MGCHGTSDGVGVRLGVNIPSHGRHELLRLVLDQLHVCKRAGHDLVIAVAGSEGDAEAASAADVYETVPYNAKNPLAGKFNRYFFNDCRCR